jgi:hypothetical protein
MIAQELNGHLDTIQGNIGKIGCIPQAMTKARAAVQASLYVRLGRSEYEDIILG